MEIIRFSSETEMYIDRLVAISVEGWLENFEKYSQGTMSEEELEGNERTSLEYIAQGIFGETVDFMLKDRGPVALLRAKPTSPGDIRVHNIDWVTVSKPYRGKGLGTRLLTHYIFSSMAEGADLITLGVHRTNPARGLYHGLGFRDITESKERGTIMMGFPITEKGVRGCIAMQALGSGSK